MPEYVWWLIGILVLFAIIAFVVSRSATGRRRTARHDEASMMREDAREKERLVRERQAAVAEADAQARRAAASADESAARAEQLRAEGERRQEQAIAAESAHAEQLRRADALDPDVPTDEQGNPLHAPGQRDARRPFRADEAGAHDRPDDIRARSVRTQTPTGTYEWDGDGDAEPDDRAHDQPI